MKGELMLRVTVSQVDIAGDGTPQEELLAQFAVDEQGVYPEEGDRTEMIMTVPVVDPDTNESITATDDPLRWAELLPSAFRTGTLSTRIEVLADDVAHATPAAEPAQELAVAAYSTAHRTHA